MFELGNRQLFFIASSVASHTSGFGTLLNKIPAHKTGNRTNEYDFTCC